MSLQNRPSCTSTLTKDVKSLTELIAGDAEGWPVVDVQPDKLLQVDVGHIFPCFSIFAELDLILHVFYLVKNNTEICYYSSEV